MKAVWYVIALALSAALLAPAPAAAQDDVMPPAPALTAHAYVLYDYTANQMLVSEGGHTRLAPAALTKMMTAYVALKAVKDGQFSLKQKAYPSLEAIRPQDNEARMFLDHNKAVTVDQLLHGLIINSGDDAVRVLVELISGDQAKFAALMNAQAKALGMTDTHFINANGEPDLHQYSSAYDLALLAAAMLRDFPKYFALYGRQKYVYNKITLFNDNRLLWNDPTVDGIKIGHNPDAGYCLAASSERGHRRLIAVVLGASSESTAYSGGQQLLNYGFRNFESMPLYGKKQPVGAVRVWKGSAKAVNVGFPNGLVLTIPKNIKPRFTAALETPESVIAPVAAGQRLGVLKLSLGGKPYAEFPVVALRGVPQANIFSRGWDTLRMLFK